MNTKVPYAIIANAIHRKANATANGASGASSENGTSGASGSNGASGAAGQGESNSKALCDPSFPRLSKFKAFTFDFRQIISKFFGKLFSKNENTPTRTIIALYVFGILGVLLLIASIILAVVIYVKYSLNAAASIAVDANESQNSPKVLPYKDDIEYQGVISTSSITSKYPILLLVATTFGAAVCSAGSIVLLLKLKSLNIEGFGDNDVSVILKVLIRLFIYSLLAFLLTALTTAYYHLKLTPFITRLNEFNKYVKDHMCFNEACEFLNELKIPKNDDVIKNKLLGINNIESLTKATFLYNLYLYYGNAYKDVLLSDALQSFQKLNAINPLGSGFSDYMNRTGSYVNNQSDNIIQNLFSIAPADSKSFLTTHKRNLISTMEEKVNDLNSKGSCLGSIVALSYFKSMITILFAGFLVLPVIMVIDYKITNAC